jgi:hypothetical protein
MRRTPHLAAVSPGPVFVPLTFVTGFSGQAFSCLAGRICGGRHIRACGIGGLVVPLARLFFWLRLRAPSGKARRSRRLSSGDAPRRSSADG